MLTKACDAEEIAEEDPVLDNSGAELMEAALEELGLARDHLTALEEKVEAYAQHFRFLQLEHDEVSQRLKQLERLLKQHSCLTSEQLLEKTAKAESSLDQWFQMEGNNASFNHEGPKLSPATSCGCALWHTNIEATQKQHTVVFSTGSHFEMHLYASNATMIQVSLFGLPFTMPGICRVRLHVYADPAYIASTNMGLWVVLQASEEMCRRQSDSSRLSWRMRLCN